MSIFVVLGAKQNTGLEIVRRLLEKPETDVAEVRALVRDPSKVAADAMPVDPRLKIIAGDATKAETLKVPFTGAKAVFFAASGSSYETCESVDWNGPGICAAVATEVGAGRVVLVSSQLVHPSNRFSPIRGILNTIATGLFARSGMMDFKFAGEQLLRRSGHDYCIVRPGQLTQGSAGEVPLHIAQTNGSFREGGGSTSRGDVSALCVAAALAPAARNTTFELSSGGAGSATALTDDFFSTLDADWDAHWTEGLEEAVGSTPGRRGTGCFGSKSGD